MPRSPSPPPRGGPPPRRFRDDSPHRPPARDYRDRRDGPGGGGYRGGYRAESSRYRGGGGYDRDRNFGGADWRDRESDRDRERGDRFGGGGRGRSWGTYQGDARGDPRDGRGDFRSRDGRDWPRQESASNSESKDTTAAPTAEPSRSASPEEGQITSPVAPAPIHMTGLPARPHPTIASSRRRSRSPSGFRRFDRVMDWRDRDRERERERDRDRERFKSRRSPSPLSPMRRRQHSPSLSTASTPSRSSRFSPSKRAASPPGRAASPDKRPRLSSPEARSPSISTPPHPPARPLTPVAAPPAPSAPIQSSVVPLAATPAPFAVRPVQTPSPFPTRLPPTGPRSERLGIAPPAGPRALAHLYGGPRPPITPRMNPYAANAAAARHDADSSASPNPPAIRIAPLSASQPGSAPRLSWSERKSLSTSSPSTPAESPHVPVAPTPAPSYPAAVPQAQAQAAAQTPSQAPVVVQQPMQAFKPIVKPYGSSPVTASASRTPLPGSSPHTPGVGASSLVEKATKVQEDEPMLSEEELAERKAKEDEARILAEIPPLLCPFGGASWEVELANHNHHSQTLVQNTLRLQAAERHAAMVLADAEGERVSAMERRKWCEAQLMQGSFGVGIIGGV